MRDQCDRVYRRKLDRAKFSVELLIFVVRHLYMKMLRQIMDKEAEAVGHGRPGKPVEELDEAGLPLVCTIRSLLCASIGHKIHRKEVLSGFISKRPTTQGPEPFDHQVCGIF